MNRRETGNLRLIRVRKEAGLKQSDVAKQIGVCPASYSKYERMITEPAPRRQEEISQVLEKPIKYLFPKSIESSCYTAKTEDAYDNFERKRFSPRRTSHETDIGKLIDAEELSILLHRALLKELTPKERTIIKLRYGFLDGNCYTFKEIGKKFKFNESRAQALNARAIRKLKYPDIIKRLTPFL